MTWNRPTIRQMLPALTAIAGTSLAAFAYNGARSREAERSDPAAGRFLEFEDGRLHYIEAGSGDPVILLHGNLVDSLDFVGSDILSRLARRHRVIAFDRPGSGHSTALPGSGSIAAQADRIASAMERLGAGNAIVLGHSIGATVALKLAISDPALVSSLVLVSGYYYPTARLDSALVAPSGLPFVGPALTHTISPFLARLALPKAIAQMFAPHDIAEGFEDSFSAELATRPSQLHQMSKDGADMVLTARRNEARYSGIKVPIIVVHGSADRIVATDDQAERFCAEVDTASLRLVRGGGHMVHYASPGDVVSAVAAASARA
jgi:pimeloyl-ACP methyl ester carboxylesterase